MKTNKILALSIAVLPLLMLHGCALDAFDPKPDDPAYAPALPEESYTDVVPNGSIYSLYNNSNGLYTDTKAHRVGDIISVTLEESTSAKKSADTDISSNNSMNLGAVSVGGKTLKLKGRDTSASFSNTDKFEGEGSANQSNSLKGSISVSVVRVFANGNLQVRGEKWLMLNNGDEYVRVTGIIRPEDISSDNSVSSQRIADARIQYGGTGDLANSNKRGWLSRFFNSAFNIFF